MVGGEGAIAFELPVGQSTATAQSLQGSVHGPSGFDRPGSAHVTGGWPEVCLPVAKDSSGSRIVKHSAPVHAFCRQNPNA